MKKILDWLKAHTKNEKYIKPQKFVEIKRGQSVVEFIHPGHPLYDNLAEAEDNQVHLLAPNDAAYNETSLTHNFVAIVTYNNQNYILFNSFKHFKEQSIGGLLQFDENIYRVIPFFEDNEEYQMANSYDFKETYEYDHPVENYALNVSHNENNTKIIIDHGKKPINVHMIDEKRQLFTEKLTQEQIELIDYIIIPVLNTYTAIQAKRKNKTA